MIQSSFSSLSKNPFFSSIITLYTLILLYSPPFLLPFIFSPVFFFTFILLLLLLRLGASQKSSIKPQHQTSQDSNFSQSNLDSNQNLAPKLIFLKSEKNLAEELNSHKLINQDSDYAEPQQEILQDFNFPQPVSKKLHFYPNISPKLDFSKSEKNVAEELNSHEPINQDSDSAETQQETLQGFNFQHPISKKLHFNPNISPKLDFLKPEASVQEQLNQESIFSDPTKQNPNSSKPNSDNSVSQNPNSDNLNSDSFRVWDVRAPLEVIYEEDGQNDVVLERYASLSMYYPETDTDSSSSEVDFSVAGDRSSPENEGFRWDEEEVEGLIEIELYGKGKIEVEEENLIEIDLSPVR